MTRFRVMARVMVSVRISVSEGACVCVCVCVGGGVAGNVCINATARIGSLNL